LAISAVSERWLTRWSSRNVFTDRVEKKYIEASFELRQDAVAIFRHGVKRAGECVKFFRGMNFMEIFANR